MITSFFPIVPWLGSLCSGYAKTTTSSSARNNKTFCTIEEETWMMGVKDFKQN